MIFAIILFLAALPMWRFMDILAWLWPSHILYGASFFAWGLVFITLPLWLIISKKAVPLISLIIFISLGILSWSTGPISDQTTKHPELNHCGLTTYTGIFYPLHNFTTQAHADDLEVRNQLCWVQKMASRVPRSFDSVEERNDYLKLIRDKLLSPEYKYRASLPMIAYLHGVIISRLNDQNVIFEGSLFVESQKFWIDQYTVEISTREYPWWDWPHSSYIKFEYGLIERNWEAIIQGISIQ